MAKGLRPTGRRKGFKKRFGKRSQVYTPGFSGYRSTVSTRNQNSVIPRALYPPVPAQYYAALKLTVSSTEGIPALAAGCYVVDAITPWQTLAGTTYYAEYLRPLLRIYGRAHVAKVQVFYQLVNTGNAPLECALTFNNFGTLNIIPNTLNGFDQLCSYPDTKYAFLGLSTGGHDTIALSNSADIGKMLNEPTNRDNCFTSTLIGGLVAPALSGTAACPNSGFFVANRTGAGGSCIVRRQFVYHIKFMDRHAQSQTDEI